MDRRRFLDVVLGSALYCTIPARPAFAAGPAFSVRERNELAGVHADLRYVVERAARDSEVDFIVVEGLRSRKRQAKLVSQGRSQTMDSRHLTGHAVDLAVVWGGDVSWDPEHYRPLGRAMLDAAGDLGVSLVWGGHWENFKDFGHFHLPRRYYPD